MENDFEYFCLHGLCLSGGLTFQCQLRVLAPGTNSSASSVLRHGGSEAAVTFPVSFMDYLYFTLIFQLRSVGISRFSSSGKSVSQMCRPGIRPALPTVQAQGVHPRRSRHDTPLHSTSNAESVPERRLGAGTIRPPPWVPLDPQAGGARSGPKDCPDHVGRLPDLLTDSSISTHSFVHSLLAGVVWDRCAGPPTVRTATVNGVGAIKLVSNCATLIPDQ